MYFSNENVVITFNVLTANVMSILMRHFLCREKGHDNYIHFSRNLIEDNFQYPLRWLRTVSSTIQDVDFDSSLLPLFIN